MSFLIVWLSGRLLVCCCCCRRCCCCCCLLFVVFVVAVCDRCLRLPKNTVFFMIAMCLSVRSFVYFLFFVAVTFVVYLLFVVCFLSVLVLKVNRK